MGFDLDDIFSYSTVKTVKIRDRYLGFLHYSAMAGIFIYIIVFTVLINRGYLAIESPVGNTRFTFRRPYSGNNPNPTPTNLLPYCLTEEQQNITTTIPENQDCQLPGAPVTFPNWPCYYWDEDDAVYPTAEANAIMLTTRFTTATYVLPNCSLTEYDCEYVSTTNDTTYYVADAESFTLLIDHAMRAPISGLQRSGNFISGKLLKANGDHYNEKLFNKSIESLAHKVPGTDTYQSTILKLSTVLNAAGISSLDESSNSDLSCTESYRHAGMVLLLFIRYDNKYSFNQKRVDYTLQFQRLTQTEFKVTEQIYLNPTYDANKATYDIYTSLNQDRHGVRIVAIALGEIGHFEFQSLLLTLVSGLGLMAISTLVVDLLATTLLPNKKIYSAYKYQTTVDFSDYRAGRVAPSPDVEFELAQMGKNDHPYEK